MEFLGDFLAKFKNIIVEKSFIVTTLQTVVTETTSLTVKTSDISFNEGVVTIKARPGVKLELRLHERAIINEMKRRLPNVVIKKII